MKHWQETSLVLDRVVQLGRGGRPSALATVTRVEGSAYRRPGAKLLVEDNGSVLGGVSGGCLEEDVREVGREVLASGRSRLLCYETGDDETKVWGLGLGCDGQVDIAVLPIPPEAALGPWARVRELLEKDSPFALSTRLQEGSPCDFLAIGESGWLAGTWHEPPEDVEAAARAALHRRQAGIAALGATRVFTEILRPPPTLLVCGAGEDARALVALGATVGFRVVVADHRSGHLSAGKLPEARRLLLLGADEAPPEIADRDTFAVVKTHSLTHDTAWVKRLIATNAAYVGVLGPRKRTLKILSDLGIESDPRVYGPVGLDLGAEGPEQVALSVVSEMLAVREGRSPRPLREREVGMRVHA